jgi:hypothetical protein
MRSIPLTQLDAHPDSANRMSAPMLEKLAAHIREGGRYPAIIVRPAPESRAPQRSVDRPRRRRSPGAQRFQIIDGHARVEALRSLGRRAATCDVWRVDDEQAAILLATLNRLRGNDDPHRRAALLARLAGARGAAALAARLPEDARRLRAMLALATPPGLAAPSREIAPSVPMARNAGVDPPPARLAAPGPSHAPAALDLQPLTFFLAAPLRSRLLDRLRAFPGTRSEALASLLGLGAGPACTSPTEGAA